VLTRASTNWWVLVPGRIAGGVAGERLMGDHSASTHCYILKVYCTDATVFVAVHVCNVQPHTSFPRSSHTTPSHNATALCHAAAAAAPPPAAASLLATAFECWMVSEHLARGYAPALLPITFSTFIGASGAVAVASGLTASQAVEKGWGLAAPFDLSAGVVILGTCRACAASAALPPCQHG
jgi:Sugar-tranasporters, 12 TM